MPARSSSRRRKASSPSTACPTSRCQAGLVGHDARQSRARLGGQRHRRRAHSDADAVPDHDRQGDAEQRADADVHPGAAQSRRAGDLGRQGIRRPQGRRRRERRSRRPSTKKKADGKEVKAAMTFPGGTHDLWIRYWLAAGGIDPDKDVETIVVPPPQMVANMKVGTMDCFCVGEPWNAQLDQPGHRLHRGQHRRDLEQASGESRFGMRADWVDEESERRQGAADGGAWRRSSGATRPRTRTSLRRSSASAHWFNVPVADILDRTKGEYRLRQPARWSRTARTS